MRLEVGMRSFLVLLTGLGLLGGHEESVQGEGGGGHRWKYERSVEGEGGQLSSADRYCERGVGGGG